MKIYLKSTGYAELKGCWRPRPVHGPEPLIKGGCLSQSLRTVLPNLRYRVLTGLHWPAPWRIPRAIQV